jgi:hypothetical protein
VTEEEASQKDWDMVFALKPEGKSVMTSKIDQHIKHAADKSIKMYKA